METKKKVAYFYNNEIGNYNYGKLHLMNPKRISMTHSLIVGYGVYKDLDVYTTREATKEEIMQFHDQDYVEYLSNYVSSSKIDFLKKNGCSIPLIDEDAKNDCDKKKQYGIDVQADCPGFDGLYTFSQLSTGGSIDAAHLIINNAADIAINWGGGLHHAKKGEAYGFCYVNDIVICILELLKVFPRVLYIDIDVHHGDGVEEAFYTTNRVMTVSFHEFGEDFFPGTGGLNSNGEGLGKNYAVNVPLRPGMDDESYVQLFKNVMNKVMEVYRPDVVVFQTGADSLANDKIGHFNLSIKGHGQCLTYMMGFNVPLVVLGGGGYTIQNVSRCWAFETGLLVKKNLNGPIPVDDPFFHLYEKQNVLHVPIQQVENKNSKEDLNKIQEEIFKQLKDVECAPGVPFHTVPRTFLYDDEEYFDEHEMDKNHDYDGNNYDQEKLNDYINGYHQMDIEQNDQNEIIRKSPLLIEKRNKFNHI
ncbi:hypothetical protein ABPG74_014463 [Tetrahymena malaccensis]